MGFSYSGDPGASPLDAVRFEIQDTDARAPLFGDPEITACIVEEAGDPKAVTVTTGGLLRAAARLMEALSRRFAMQADSVRGTLHVEYSKQMIVYAERAAELRLRAQGLNAPFVGGLSESGKEALEGQEDLVVPAFARKQFAVPGVQTRELPLPTRTLPI